MNLENIKNKFGIRKPFHKIENGLYYIPSPDKRFSNLKPSLKDIVSKKYLENHN